MIRARGESGTCCIVLHSHKTPDAIPDIVSLAPPLNPPSEHVSLEVAILAVSSPAEERALIALVLASDADVRTYVHESLQNHIQFEVITTGSVAAALDVAARSTPRLLIVTHDERKLLRHLPAVPAVLLSEDLPAAEALDERLAPLVLMRGAFRAQQLIDVATSLLAGGDGKSRILSRGP